MLPEEIINELPHDFSIAIQTSLQNHHKAYNIMDIFHHSGICLTLQKTSFNLRNHLKNTGINTSKIHIIDPIAKVIGSITEPQDTTHIPYNLHHMLDTTEKTLKNLPLKERFMIIDSLHALTLVYDERKILTFLHKLNNTLKINHTKAIYLYNKEQLPENIQEALHKIVDKVIQVN